MPELSAAPSINDTRTQALLVLISRLAALDLTTLLVYRSTRWWTRRCLVWRGNSTSCLRCGS